MTWRTEEEHAAETGPTKRYIYGLVRRVGITLSRTAAKWQVRGKRGGTGGDEVFDVELFPGIGIFARPPADGAPEACLVSIGGTKSSAIIATRDEKTRKLIAAQVGEGETAVYNPSGIVLLKADGTIEIRSHAGIARSVAFTDELNALKDYVNNQFCAVGGHSHVVAGAATTTVAAVGGPGASPPSKLPPVAVGTSKARLE